ncbi:MAG TPA: hypothetical protein VMV92_25685 [Streptosporangiaceae bacterium]|nr:hypothetical protein [Streptosporangiaceae bacterium]
MQRASARAPREPPCVSHPAAGEQECPAGRPVLAPKLAAFGKLAMGITMGYMLILML